MKIIQLKNNLKTWEYLQYTDCTFTTAFLGGVPSSHNMKTEINNNLYKNKFVNFFYETMLNNHQVYNYM